MRDGLRVCFVIAGEQEDLTVGVFIPFSKGGLHTKHSWTRNGTRHVRDSSTLFECVVEISRIRRLP